ncbi:MAG: ABC transporter permease [Candidatus Eisenbacteria bacterium]|uniref:ABC transporter permease n=1 Tax=Eiseniibacteriota bacterium TaxID=2212470 RepID=A0A933SER8_UNCEI|nr:ABC transporter permease [Candidatus Eisenbacteria bacterium]
MKFSFSRSMVIARREYLTTVRRKAFLFSLLATPVLVFFSTFVSGKLAADDARAHQREARIIAVVDSAGALANTNTSFEYTPPADVSGPGTRTLANQNSLPLPLPEKVPMIMRDYDSQQAALDSLEAGHVNTVVVLAADFLTSGRARRYEHDTRVFTSSGDDRPLRQWMTRGLLANVDSTRIERVLTLGRGMDLYVPDKGGAYTLKDDTKELTSFFLPFIVGMLLSVSIITGGQYLLQGVSEEKETRILESMLCTVSPDDLVVGKLVGLGGAGLTLVGVWIAAGLALLGTSFAFIQVELPVTLAVVGFAYFVLGYLFYASLMTGIGAVTNNLREAQQMAMIFTMMNFFPFYVLVKLLNSPNSGIAVGMSLFPPTAATSMMLRLAAASMTGAQIPVWQVAASLGLLALTAFVTLKVASKVFRLGLLLYGKTPTLPEIMKLVRQD